jgi:transcriptional regulator GlxA family with amidase domain
MKHQPIRHAPANELEPRHVAIFACPGVALLDAVGPLEVFAAANIVVAERTPECAKPYQVEIWAEHVGTIDGSFGVSLNATRSIATAAPFELDTLIVAGSLGIPASRPCVDWLRQSTGGIRRVGGICTGVFLLAEAGLLDGCRAVTHWAFCDELARRYPTIKVDPDPIFLRDGRFYTTAGMTAGMDLALALVQDDLGRDVALATARLLVLFLKRPGGQSQFSAHLAAQLDGDGPIAELQRWILDHLDTDRLRRHSAAPIAASQHPCLASMGPAYKVFFKRTSGLYSKNGTSSRTSPRGNSRAAVSRCSAINSRPEEW